MLFEPRPKTPLPSPNSARWKPHFRLCTYSHEHRAPHHPTWRAPPTERVPHSEGSSPERTGWQHFSSAHLILVLAADKCSQEVGAPCFHWPPLVEWRLYLGPGAPRTRGPMPLPAGLLRWWFHAHRVELRRTEAAAPSKNSAHGVRSHQRDECYDPIPRAEPWLRSSAWIRGN